MSFSNYASKKLDDIFSELKTTTDGLLESEVKKRLELYGQNKISVKETTWWQIFLRQFKSPFVYLLFFAAILALYLGEEIDATFIFFFVILSAVLGFVQEYNSQKAVEALKKFLVNHVKIVRGGSEIFVNSSEIVPGDICVLEPGDIIQADLRFYRADNLLIDESILTGESMPVAKTTLQLKDGLLGAHEAQNIGFSGTTIVQGKGLGVVFATGTNTEIGAITKLTAESEGISTFEKGLSKLSSYILKLIIATLAFVFIANFLIKKADGAVGLADMILFAIALAVSVIPEALPVVSTLSFSRGAFKLAKNNVVIKRLSAVEDLGSIEVLCTDKTGTITENKLSVSNIKAEDDKLCLLYGTLASSFLSEKSDKNNSFDLGCWSKLIPSEREKLNLYKRLNEIPFDPERKRNSVLIQSSDDDFLIVRGAPEVVINLCQDISPEKKVDLLNWITREGLEGKRSIALATKILAGGTSYSAKEEKDLTFLGLISFIDPIKTSATEAINEANKLGVKVKILTGDSYEVAMSVAKQVGIIKNATEVLTGEEFEKMPETEQELAVEKVNVFVRVSPKQKYRIVELLQKKYEVGFMGDGINDAPALKLAGVALAVDTASDIARDASDIVLLNPSLRVVIDGIRGGRDIFTNMDKYLKATLISNFGNFFAIAITLFFIPFLPLLPVQILLLNLLTDSPMIAIAMDSVDRGELRRPKTYNIKEIITMSAVFGLISMSFVLLLFFLFYKESPAVLQTNWFIGNVLIELTLVYSIRTKLSIFKATKPSKIIAMLSVVAASLALVLPFTFLGNKIFKFVPPTSKHMAVILLVVFSYFIATEIFKLVYYKFRREIK